MLDHASATTEAERIARNKLLAARESAADLISALTILAALDGEHGFSASVALEGLEGLGLVTDSDMATGRMCADSLVSSIEYDSRADEPCDLRPQVL